MVHDHVVRMQRARLALEGLSIGDGFGECFFGFPDKVEWVISERALPTIPWHYTDDTMMALGIYHTLDVHGCINQDELARTFGRVYTREPSRGYGGTAHSILTAIDNGIHWSSAAGTAFSGMGSMGNGGAMRVAPVGAYFCDDYERVTIEARKSAAVTHAHPDGQAGAIAAAVASAFAANVNGAAIQKCGSELFKTVLQFTPKGETYAGLEAAAAMSLDLSVRSAAGFLGNGSEVCSHDTVPFCIWAAARHLDSYQEAMWQTVSALGDRDTTCAIVGGIVALAVGSNGIPAEWLRAREALPI